MAHYQFQDAVNNNKYIKIPEMACTSNDKYHRLHEHSVIVRNPGLINRDHVNGNINDNDCGPNGNITTIDRYGRNLKQCQENKNYSLSLSAVQNFKPHNDGGNSVSESSRFLLAPKTGYQAREISDNSDYLDQNVFKNNRTTGLSVQDAHMSSIYHTNDQCFGKPLTKLTEIRTCKIDPNRIKSDNFVCLNDHIYQDCFDFCQFKPMKTKSLQNIGKKQLAYKQTNQDTTERSMGSNISLNFGASGDTKMNQDFYSTHISSPMSVCSPILNSWFEGSESSEESRLIICESDSDNSVSIPKEDNGPALNKESRQGYLGREKSKDGEQAKSNICNGEKNDDIDKKINYALENKHENFMNDSIYFDALSHDGNDCQESSMYVTCIDDNEYNGNFTDTTWIDADNDIKDQPHPLKLEVDKNEIKNNKFQFVQPSHKSSCEKMNFKIETRDFKNSTFKLFFEKCIDGLLHDEEGIYDLTNGKKLFEMKDWIEKLITHNSTDKNIQIVDLIHLISSCVVLAHTALKSLSFSCGILEEDLHNSSSHFEGLLMDRLKVFVKDGLMLSDLAFSLYEQSQKDEPAKEESFDNIISEKKAVDAKTSQTIQAINLNETMSDSKAVTMSKIGSSKEMSDIDGSEVLSPETMLLAVDLKALASKTLSDTQDCKVISKTMSSDLKVPSSETVSDIIDSKVLSTKTVSGTIDSKVIYSAALPLTHGKDSKSTTSNMTYFKVTDPENVPTIVDSKVPSSKATTDNSKLNFSESIESNVRLPEAFSEIRDPEVSSTKTISDGTHFKELPPDAMTSETSDNTESNNMHYPTTLSDIMNSTVFPTNTTTDEVNSNISMGSESEPLIGRSSKSCRKESDCTKEYLDDIQNDTQKSFRKDQCVRYESDKTIRNNQQKSAETSQIIPTESIHNFPNEPAKVKYIHTEPEIKHSGTLAKSPIKSLTDPEKAKTMFNNLKLICSPVLTSVMNSLRNKSTQVSQTDLKCFPGREKMDLIMTDSNGKNKKREKCKDKQRLYVCGDDNVEKTKLSHLQHTQEQNTRNNKACQTINVQKIKKDKYANKVITHDKNDSKVKTPYIPVTNGEKRKGVQEHEMNAECIGNGSPCKIRKTDPPAKIVADNICFQSSPSKMRKTGETSINVNKNSKYHDSCGKSVNDMVASQIKPKRDSTKKTSSTKLSVMVMSPGVFGNKTDLVFEEKQPNGYEYSPRNITKTSDSIGQNSRKVEQNEMAQTASKTLSHRKDGEIVTTKTSSNGKSRRDNSKNVKTETSYTNQNVRKHSQIAQTETCRMQNYRRNDINVKADIVSKEQRTYKKDNQKWTIYDRSSNKKDDQYITLDTTSKGQTHRKDRQNETEIFSKIQSETASKKHNTQKDCQNITSETPLKLHIHKKDDHKFTKDNLSNERNHRIGRKRCVKRSCHDRTVHSSKRTLEIVTSANCGRNVALQVSIHGSKNSLSGNESLSCVMEPSHQKRHSCNTPTLQQHTEKKSADTSKSTSSSYAGMKSKSADTSKSTSSSHAGMKSKSADTSKSTSSSQSYCRTPNGDYFVKTAFTKTLFSTHKNGCHGVRTTTSSTEKSGKVKQRIFESENVTGKTPAKDSSNRGKLVEPFTHTTGVDVRKNAIESNIDQLVIGITSKTERQLAAHANSTQSKPSPRPSHFVTEHNDKVKEKQNGRFDDKENHRSRKTADLKINFKHFRKEKHCRKETSNNNKDSNVCVEPCIRRVRPSSSVLEEVTCENYPVETSKSSEALNITSGRRNDVLFSSLSDSSSEDEEQWEPFYVTGYSVLHSLSHTLMDQEADLPPLILPSKMKNKLNRHGNQSRCHRTDFNTQRNIQEILANEYLQKRYDNTPLPGDFNGSNNSEISNSINRSDIESISPSSRRYRHRRRYVSENACTSSSSEEVIPECRQRGLQSKKECFMILDRVYNYKLAEPFRHEVRSEDVPGYYLVIKRGMCLDMIAHKLRDNIYEKEEDFVTDMRLIFSNCRLFHVFGSPIYEAGQAVERYFDQMMKEIFPDLNFY